MKAYQKIINMADSLKLKSLPEKIDELVQDAERSGISYVNFLARVLEAEIEDRSARRLKRNMSAAHFPVQKRMEKFEFGKVKGIGKSEAVNLLDCAWIDRLENILFFGPPGVGKTHLSIALGINAVENGYTVCFEKITNLIKLLKTAEIQKSAEYRLRKIRKANVLIIDEIGYTPIERKEANLFFTLISELYEKTAIVITSNKSFENWAEMLGDEVLTTALLDRLLYQARIFNLDGRSYRLAQNKTTKKEVQ